MSAMTETANLPDPQIGASADSLSGLTVDYQLAIEPEAVDDLPDQESLVLWAQAAYTVGRKDAGLPSSNDVTIRVVSAGEITELNREFRGKDKPTNVLSFPVEMPEGVELSLLGDVIICHEIVIAESMAEGKSPQNHYAHMVVHGILHLCGFDHQCDQDAVQMEALEVSILASSQIPNPYELNQ